jgi:hypothetical protein
MNRLRLVVAAVLTAVILSTAAIAAPSASAAPYNNCAKIFQKLQMSRNVLNVLVATGYGGTYTAWEVKGRTDAYADAYRTCVG